MTVLFLLVDTSLVIRFLSTAICSFSPGAMVTRIGLVICTPFSSMDSNNPGASNT